MGERGLKPAGEAARPRLGGHVEARRHLVGDRSVIVLRDAARDRRMALGEREWRALAAMDGTRDLEGVARASGIARDHVAAFVAELSRLGLLAGTPDADPPASPARDLPVRALPGYRFRCTGAGGCCGLVDTVLFTPLEAARARAAAPELLDAGDDEARAFLPARGLDRRLLAVALRDGACVYLDGDRRCRVYAARPHGCRTFPRRHVDVGHEIRVAPRIACACELEPGDALLTSATRGAELPAALWVERLPAEVRLGARVVCATDALAFTDALELDGDVLARVRAHADALGAPPHDPAAARRAIEHALAEHAFRGPADLVRRALALARAAADAEPQDVLHADEALAARAHAFAGGLLLGGDVGAGLRALEARLALARRIPPEARVGFAAHPIAVLGALAQATGLFA